MLENCSLLNKNDEYVKNNQYKIEKSTELIYNNIEQKCRMRQKYSIREVREWILKEINTW